MKWIIIHNCIAHPLLVVSSLIEWFHDYTASKMPSSKEDKSEEKEI